MTWKNLEYYRREVENIESGVGMGIPTSERAYAKISLILALLEEMITKQDKEENRIAEIAVESVYTMIAAAIFGHSPQGKFHPQMIITYLKDGWEVRILDAHGDFESVVSKDLMEAVETMFKRRMGA